MKVNYPMTMLPRCVFLMVTAFCFFGPAPAQAGPQELELNFAPARTEVNFTLGATLHTVHGSFQLKRGAVHFDPGTNKLSGEILVDATSGHTGNDGRDHKMHQDVLQSAPYPDIIFRPDRLEGKVTAAGTSDVQVHGTFIIHGSEHEITIPVRVEMAPGHWTASGHFTVPYVQWGMKNPSTFVLRVEQSVDLEIKASGDTQ
jgi:polyisoprenoid-binding protein YceI